MLMLQSNIAKKYQSWKILQNSYTINIPSRHVFYALYFTHWKVVVKVQPCLSALKQMAFFEERSGLVSFSPDLFDLSSSKTE